MSKEMKRWLTAAWMLAVALTAPAQNEAITNETVLSLLNEGFSSEEIIGAIENSTDRSITYSIDFMRRLKAAGADTQLTTYIQKVAKADFGYEGVLWWNTGSRPKKIYRTQFEREQKGTNLGTIAAVAAGTILVGSAVRGHIGTGTAVATAAGAGVLMSTGKDVQKLVLPGATSKTKLTGEAGRYPVFRFIFPKGDKESFAKTAENWYQIVMNNIESPNEFQCIKMQVKQPKKNGKGGRRMFPNSMSYTVMGFEGSNASTREMVDFEISEVNNSTFEVTFPNGLEPGEYCFFYKGGLGNATFKEHPFGFDFTVAE